MKLTIDSEQILELSLPSKYDSPFLLLRSVRPEPLVLRSLPPFHDDEESD